MNAYEIPVTLGPGSQPVTDEDRMDFPAIPQGMDTYRPPVLPADATVAGRPRARAALHELQGILDGYPAQGIVDLSTLVSEDEAVVGDILGEGEVSIRIEGRSRLRVQESIFAGVWRVDHLGAGDRVLSRLLEVGPVPATVLEHAFTGAPASLPAPAGESPAGVINAPAIVTELEDHARTHRPGAAAHVVNLTLLPLSPEDLAWLQERLGEGPVTMLSRGYGNCRITSTVLRNVWWVQYFNTMDTLILNTLEVVEVPDVARAAPEDLEDSAARLREVLEALT